MSLNKSNSKKMELVKGIEPPTCCIKEIRSFDVNPAYGSLWSVKEQKKWS